MKYSSSGPSKEIVAHTKSFLPPLNFVHFFEYSSISSFPAKRRTKPKWYTQPALVRKNYGLPVHLLVNLQNSSRFFFFMSLTSGIIVGAVCTQNYLVEHAFNCISGSVCFVEFLVALKVCSCGPSVGKDAVDHQVSFACLNFLCHSESPHFNTYSTIEPHLTYL